MSKKHSARANLTLNKVQRAADEAICLADGYYHRKFIAPKTGKEVDTGYYLHVPEAWYVNS